MNMDTAVLRAPGALRRLFAGKAVTGATATTTPLGELWHPSTGDELPLIVIFSTEPRSMRWVASSLAAALPAAVLVAAERITQSVDESAHIASAALSFAPGAHIDSARVGVVGEGDAAAAALRAAGSSAHRLALISPRKLGAAAVDGIPPTLLQFAQGGASAAESTVWERRLRDAAVAVRAIDYTAVGDGWVRYPRAIRGSRRGYNDLLAFFRRGLGDESTFTVIPGWDLH
jgi:acetyl esterase/lipase